MSEDRVPDPGLPEHVERYTDAEASAGNRAARTVVLLFGGVVPLMAIVFIVGYFTIPGDTWIDVIFGRLLLQHLVLGLAVGIAMLSIGIGLVHWAKQIMADHEVVEERHPVPSTDEDKAAFGQMWRDGVSDSRIGRRTLIGASLVGGLGVAAVPAILTLGDMGPWPTAKVRKETIEKTLWAEGVRLVTAETHHPIRPDEMVVGQLINAEPENLAELHGVEYNRANAKAPVVLVKIAADDLHVAPERADWNVDGVLCYSKICTHVGCPISLYDQSTQNLLCPCHQSTFDLADNGVVVFGPAARSLPQLPIAVDAEGYLIAQRDFDVPVGPSYFERDSSQDYEGER